MNLLPLDVGEPERAVALDPDRTLAELGRHIPDADRLAHPCLRFDG
jgi:hypothetical protein